MSGQVQITLRPPPNVEFVHGFPGIPPGGPDRTQAAVRGAVEIRTAPLGAKAKWVRIELRKVETLPGGGVGNTFFDFVGPSPVNLWTASEEYAMLRTQDFPFSIRIPESIPPTIALDNRAGVHYELVASVCVLEKKGFFRRKKSRVQTQIASITIDKHELHSAWPLYCQPETRKQSHEGLTLTAERNNTCYGPGDPISINATLKSDMLTAIICRGFELTLNETTIFRGLLTGKKSAAPIVKTSPVCVYKHQVNANLYGGSQQRAELVCHLSPEHTTTTLNAARHIDITYVLTVKAIISPGDPVSIDLPVIVTNWQRNVSLEAIRRIGPAPTLSLLPANVPPSHQAPAVDHTLRSSTFPNHRPQMSTSGSSQQSSTLPLGRSEDVGYGAGLGLGVRNPHRPSPSNSSLDEFGARPTAPTNSARQRPTSRFTITNQQPDSPPPGAQFQAQQTRPGAPKGLWPPTAEDEKARLYERAQENVKKVQGSAVMQNSPPPKNQAQTQSPAKSPPRNAPWPTSEQEKLRLFNEAQAAVKKTQGSYSPESSLHGRSTSDVDRTLELSRGNSASGSASKSPPAPAPAQNQKRNGPVTPAELYAQAISARNETLSKQQSLPTPNSPTRVVVPQYMSAEQEKAALRRYEAAKLAVDRVQYGGEFGGGGGSGSGSGAIPLDPSNPLNPPKDTDDLPPPFEMSAKSSASVIPASHIGEKERLRLEYERQDAARKRLQQRQDTLPPSFSESQSGPPSGSQRQSPPPSSSRTHSPSPAQNGLSTKRPTPAPPAVPPSSRILTAAEEKAMLKARYAAEVDAKDTKKVSPPYLNGNGNGHHINNVSPSRPGTSHSHSQYQSSAPNSHTPTPEPPSSPPPLMPRPPVEYIQETREEDARVSQFAMNGLLPPDEVIARSGSILSLKNPVTTPVYLPTPISGALPLGPAASPLEVRPFSPFSAAFDHTPGLPLPGPPPPLPPKPLGD